MENLDKLVKELCKLPDETGWVEFKHNNCDPKMIGEDISALANSAVLAGRSYAYMIWGVDDSTHEVVGTTVRLKHEKKGNQEIENWLRFLLSKNADFSFESTDIEGKHVEIIVISKAMNLPVMFEKIDYIRVGSYTKKLVEFPMLQMQLWDKLRNDQFESLYAISDLSVPDIFTRLDMNPYFDIQNIPTPSEQIGYIHYMLEDGVIVKQDNGLYAITNLGAVLFAKKLSDFPRINRKHIRVIQYEGNNRLSIKKEETFAVGYVEALEKAVAYILALIPTKEDITAIRRTTIPAFPIPAVREAVANAIIHQDFSITGTGPVVEIFDNRIEVTNPGTPLVAVNRIVDNPPKSRNEKLAGIMRRLGMCEELGRGWDRMVISCEHQQTAAPRIQIYEDSTKVSLFSNIQFANITPEDKLWSLYLHSCLKYIEGDALTNSSLRVRFGLPDTSSGAVSRLIKEAVAQGLIKPLDPTTAPRHMRYIPVWA